ncbi:hypothetical protein DENIS_3850 [Desulfonema ishimotonii]|uniref:Putative zinc-finger domain-containing protein n=1 Tax=Desulfonema ishimotonii TaxID=45657 RepID=A0A401G0Z3_9BACT|nr:zf-HC2 domain-containing protein [Desulfonema ishimotonii]GBC62866.1 hypothetical protein DENIS_3850 [Desulfonema ishimotonii]
MKPCPEYRKILWLDVYGELASRDRLRWEHHLETCPACREERAKTLRLIYSARQTAPAPEIPARQTEAMTRSIMAALDRQTKKSGWLNRPARLIPSLVAACLIMVVAGTIGWFGTAKSPFFHTGSQTISRLSPDEKLLLKDFEVISNLELLEEFEALEKLVEAVDPAEYGVLSPGKINVAGAERRDRNDAHA